MATPAPVLRAAVFDLDGTLVDSMSLVLRAFAHALKPFRPELTEEMIFSRLGGPPERTLRELIGDAAGAEAALRRLDAFGFANADRVQPFSGMRDMLEALHVRGLKLAVWTGRDRATTEVILHAHDLTPFFDMVVCGDDFWTHKPHPEGLLKIAEGLSVPVGEMLYAGDADADVLGGVEAGIRTLLIRHGRKTDESILEKAWRVVDKPEEAYWIIQDQTRKIEVPAKV